MSKGTEAGRDRVGPGNRESLCGYNARWVGGDVGDKPGKIGCQGGEVGVLNGIQRNLDLIYLGFASP